MATDFDWQREVTSAPVGSVEAERMPQDGVRELGDALAQGINVFVERLPDGSGAG
jgi:hypothetical protein